ncbi:entericidin [Luteolibacter marinus]|uniref:entericidin n=1 Tax=Luteolibacter marinus TaxID=2776705 RepID=UPI001865A7EB|nr:entericidin [Luteolibacter marinus]
MNNPLNFRFCLRLSKHRRRAPWPMVAGCLIFGFGALGLSSCGTARGLGSDIERAGEEIQEHVPN